MWRFVERFVFVEITAVATHVLPAEVIDHDMHDVGLIGCMGNSRRGKGVEN